MSDARTVIEQYIRVWAPMSSPAHAGDIIAALAEAGLEIRKSVDLTKHYSWCCLVETECNCGGREGSE